MTSQDIRAALRQYVASLNAELGTGQAGEHSYRPAFKTMIEAVSGGRVSALNEPLHIPAGQPDFIVQDGAGPVGYVECKDIDVNLNREEKSEQLQRYRSGLSNLILTDYLEFRWYVDGVFRRTVRLGEVDQGGRIRLVAGGLEDIELLLGEFLSSGAATVGTSEELAQALARKARILRHTIARILDQNPTEGRVAGLLNAYRQHLVAEFNREDFADMYAQTAAYGLFAARQRHNLPGQFTRSSAMFSDTTPFIGDLLDHVAGRNMPDEAAWIANDIALLLERANMAEIMRDFGRQTAQQDPIIHFYEDFLAAYDPGLREKRGVYYTPEPVVSYIVRSIDSLLKDRFGITDGLANTQRIDVAEGGDAIRPHRVTILDPAAGTGTFLRTVVRTIRQTLKENGMGGAWPSYVTEELLPRLNGFELLMAPYTICHLGLAMAIAETDDVDDADGTVSFNARINVVLTNTLEQAREEVPALSTLGEESLQQESRRADAIKRDQPVMVVLGNPPYSGHSANHGEWIRGLIESYKEGFPELRKPAQAKWLSDDYVKFIRFAQWRIEQTGEGILGFITNHSYLDNPTFRGMRHSLMETFDEIYLLDLHGNALKRERDPAGGNDENVFDIRQGVAIALFVKHANSPLGLAKIRHADLWGERGEIAKADGKYGWLEEHDVSDTTWQTLTPKSPQYFFIPRDEELEEEYAKGWPIPAIFSPNGDPAPGIVTTQDQFAISWSSEEAAQKVETLLMTSTEAEARSIWRLCSQNQWQYEQAKRDLADGSWRSQITSVLYRPFDTRVTVYDSNVAVHRRDRVMRHMLAAQNTGLCIGRAGAVTGSPQWDVVLATNSPTDLNLFRRGGNNLFPLYLYPTEDEAQDGIGRRPNLADEFTARVEAQTELAFNPDGPGDLKSTVGPEDIFHYIYAVLHSPEYRRRYADFLKSDFPRISITKNLELFLRLVELGRHVTALHLVEEHGTERPDYPMRGSDKVDSVRFFPERDGVTGRVVINHDQYFNGVSVDTWNLTIGGYRPAEKWLKDRKGRSLSYDDIKHYVDLCAALTETRRAMTDIDAAITAAGDWPLA